MTPEPEQRRPGAHLVVRGLACRRGERSLFSGVDLDVGAGDVVWLRAPNGFGKTTLLRVLCGLSRPEAGSVRWGGDRGSEQPIVYIAHANGLKDDLTVLETVRLLARLDRRDPVGDAIAAAVRHFGLHGRRGAPIRTLSQGQRRRVALTRLCLSDPQATWLLDEPFDALDGDGVARVGDLLAAHARRGGSVLFTSHVAPPIGGLPMTTVQLDTTAVA